jgi:hypothetical protein
MDNGQWTMDNGQWTMDNGQWTMDNGQWTMDNGQWTMDNFLFIYYRLSDKGTYFSLSRTASGGNPQSYYTSQNLKYINSSL